MDDNVWRSIVESHDTGIIILNLNKEVEYKNEKVEKLLGNEVNQLLGNYLKCKFTIIEQVSCQNTTNCTSCLMNNALNKVIKTGEGQLLNNVVIGGLDYSVTVSITLYNNKNIVIEIFDINDRFRELSFLNRLVDKSKDLMFFKNSKLKYEYINQSYADFFGKNKEYILGKTDIDLINENLLPKELYEQCYQGDAETLEKGRYSGVENMGEEYFSVIKESIDGGILCLARNISDEVNAMKEAETDVLTNLFNRNKYNKEIKRIYNLKLQNYGLALIDLDNLRDLNNEYGHSRGDEYLKTIGESLIKFKECEFFRIGGDEFAGLIDLDKVNVYKLFEDVFREIKSTNLTPELSISVGVIKLDIDKNYLENYEEVDKLLYKAKGEGKNRYIISS